MKKFWLTALVVIIVIGFGIYLAEKESKPVVSNDFSHVPADNELLNNMQKAGLAPLTSEGSTEHIHMHLDLVINGQNVQVPGDVGVGSNFISALHTHDDTGVIHLESPTMQDYTLGQFFDEWGVAFNDNCVGSHCTDDQNKLVVGLNGSPITNVRDHKFQAHEEIEVWYGPKSQNPDLIKSYNFAQGL